jgi:DNA topoisomerase-1
VSELWIIEAPGKARTLEAILQRLGLEAKVQATKGHLLSMPDRLNPVGIDRDLHEHLRAPKDMEIVKRIRDMAREASSVVIATDADQEGDVIAWDVAEMISDIKADPVRVRLRGMDDDSVKEAIADAQPIRKQDAVAGRTRALVDRLIGHTFSGGGMAVGRIGTALLGLCLKDPPCVHRLRLSAPSKDGGRPWLAECDVKAPLTLIDADRIRLLSLPALDVGSSAPYTAPPGHMGDIMVRAAETLDIPPSETARAMQRTYEAGRLSYPRSGSQGMTKTASRKMRKILEAAGAKFNDGLMAEKTADEVHDAPHPIGNIDLSLDPKKMGSDEGVRAMIARNLVRSGMSHDRQHAIGAKIEKFLLAEGFSAPVAQFIAALPWKRDQGPRFPGQESWVKSEVVVRRADAVLLEAAMKAGLGRPSTWANHIDGFLSRGLVDENLALTDKGRAWAIGSPQALLDPRLSAAIEKACERVDPRLFLDPAREPWEASAMRILQALPPEISKMVMATVHAQEPRPRVDYRALAEPAIDLAKLPEAGILSPKYVPSDA